MSFSKLSSPHSWMCCRATGAVFLVFWFCLFGSLRFYVPESKCLFECHLRQVEVDEKPSLRRVANV